ncbi:DNA repair protein rad18 [Rhizodiscina lignyota]|uniref:Postreplication repair E3 ubiquitin-protein ligase RAD18 n=1 Tax=Rhizodiscina lignyota TaxID=1504668 RepID=A0A9P4IS15_9PEZI|nr:DNA repair protein rad18 [Rhizodiscina lignyota]
MDSISEVSDPTDWLPTPLPLLAPVDSALRCQVCKDFYETPMITSCSHTFCSLCIRKCLSSDGRCPACREQDQASKLRRNWAIQEVVESFKTARPQVLDVAKRRENEEDGSPVQIKGRKRKWQDVGGEREDAEGARKAARQTRSQSRKATTSAISQDIVILDSEGDDDYDPSGEAEDYPQPGDGLVPCPVCGARMKEEAVWLHIERCDGNPPKKLSEARSITPQISASRHNRPPQPNLIPRLPQLNYSLLKDGALKKKFDDLGIPNWGSRELLIRRHTEWVNLYNSNADSSTPKSNRELLRELDLWERSQGGRAPARDALSKKKDFDGKAWMEGNKSQFDELIREARKKRQVPSKKEGQKEETANDAERSPNMPSALPGQLALSSTKKMPMFAMPSEPIRDGDGIEDSTQ